MTNKLLIEMVGNKVVRTPTRFRVALTVVKLVGFRIKLSTLVEKPLRRLSKTDLT